MFHVDTVADIQAIRQHVFSLERDTLVQALTLDGNNFICNAEKTHSV